MGKPLSGWGVDSLAPLEPRLAHMLSHTHTHTHRRVTSQGEDWRPTKNETLTLTLTLI